MASARTLDLVLTDLNMPGKDGLALLDGLKAINPDVPVIVMTAFGTVSTAVDAMKRGAADYLTKPIDLDELEVLVGRTLERRALVSENEALREQLASRYRLSGLDTSNATMADAINTAARAAQSRASILIRGESGTGQGSAGASHSLREPARQGAAGGGERRGAAGHPDRVRVVRPRARRVHRGRPGAARPLRAG